MAIEISTQIEIERSPEQVRAIFLDFKHMPDWSKAWFQSLEPLAADGSINEGEQLRVTLPSATFAAPIVENSPTRFAWRGSLPYIFTGEHSFRFEQSKITPGSTTFIHSERFTGLMGFVMGIMRTKTLTVFDAFNRDLKTKVESSV